MLKRSFFTLLATILLSFYSFSQTEISSPDDFLAVIEQNLSGNYIQTADIVLGDLGTLTEAIIAGEFSGTYDGNGHSISYSAAFQGQGGSSKCFGLFEKVTGTIKNLNIVNSYATLSGNGKTMNIGLICGLLGNATTKGHIINCHVMGDVNSSVTPTDDNGSDAALIAGEVIDGEIYCCSGIGNVSGVGYTGGITGHFKKGSIKGCSFVGSVKAVLPKKYYGNNDNKRSAGAYAGGIAGLTYGGSPSSPTEISLSYVNAEIEGAIGARGITNANYDGTNTTPNTINVTDCFAKGTVTAKGEGANQGNLNQTTMITSEIDSDNEVASGVNNYTTIYNSATDDQESNGSSTKSSLNGVRDAEDKTNFYFSRETGEVILVYGQNIGCETPKITAKTISRSGNTTHTYYYDVTFEENGTYEFTLKKGSEIIDSRIKENTDTIRIKLGSKSRFDNNWENLVGEYELTAKRHCISEDDQESASSLTTYISFLTLNSSNNLNFNERDCTPPTSLSVSTTSNSATITIGGFDTDTDFRYNINNGNYITGTGNTILLTGLNENTIYTVRVQQYCGGDSYSLPSTIEFIITPDPNDNTYYTIKNGPFNTPSIWNKNSVPDGENDNITIKHNVNLTHTLTLSGTTTLTIDDNSNDDNTETAILVIDQLGQLINMTNKDILGIVEIKQSINGQNKWEFIGAPFMTTTNIKKYRLETIVPVRGSDVVVSLYDDEGQAWITNPYANYTSIVETGRGYFGYPYYTGVVTFTTYGDLWDFSLNGGTGGMKEYDETDALYKLNKADVKVGGLTGGFLPLSNPYPAKLSIAKFLSQNSGLIQGGGVYRYNNNSQSFDMNPVATGDIDIAEGFFVKLASGESSIDFRQTQLTEYPTQGNKSQTAEREFVELSLTADNHSSKLYFAHNEQAELGYDIFDADKLFAMTEMTEPYFLTQGISLVKEEVNTLPYYATMNVRSYENKEVSFKANNIPQGIAVSLIDGEETIELNEGVVYTTNVSSGENANRFKVLFSQSVGLNDAEELEVNITNDNRLVNITTSEKDLQIEVYNALGQRVFATKDFNFSLNNVSAGAYMIKAFNNKASKTQKIIIK